MLLKTVTSVVLLELDFVVLAVIVEHLEISFYLSREVILHVVGRFVHALICSFASPKEI